MAKSRAPSKSTSKFPSIDETCEGIESYFDALRADGHDLCNAVLPPQKARAIAAAEKKLGIEYPDDVRAFLARGLRGASGYVEEGERFASIGFDWLGVEKSVDHTLMLRKTAADVLGGGGKDDDEDDDDDDDELDEDDEDDEDDDDEDDDPHVAVLRQGYVLTYSEPQILISEGAVYHFSFRNPVRQVARSFREFLAGWLASGCFGSHNHDLLWERVKQHVPVKLAPSKNAWLTYYKKQYPTL